MKQMLTMQDIATVAGVSRQAVTNWRSRLTVNGEPITFPSPVLADGVERFDLDEVQTYLEATGRGRAVEARLDAPALAVPSGVAVEDVVTLLLLRAEHSDDIAHVSHRGRVALAHELDPEDLYLASEVADLPDSPELADFVDALMAASLGPADALERLLTSTTARSASARGFDQEFLYVLKELASTARLHLGDDDVALDLRLPTGALVLGEGFDQGLVDATSQASRSRARRLKLMGVAPTQTSTASISIVSALGMETREALEWIEDQVALSLGDGEIAIVVGASSALCGKLRGNTLSLRQDILRVGGLVAALTFPRGLWKEAHKLSVGVWVLQGGVEHHGVMVADLMAATIDASELAADLSGALAQTGARQYRYGLINRYADAWTRSSVVPAGVVAPTPVVASVQTPMERVVAATAVTREEVANFDLNTMEVPGRIAVQKRSLLDLVEVRRAPIRRINGSRIAVEHFDASGTTRVISADLGIDRRIDPLVAAAHYEHASRTERGDVIFAVRPRPIAVVDEVGGSLVAYPSQILRLDPKRSGIGPLGLAQFINQVPDAAREWKAWRIPRLSIPQVSALEAALEEARVHQRELERHMQATRDIADSLLEGVMNGALDITQTSIKKAG
jgi:hypothetical protein